MRKRTRSREVALKILYASDITRDPVDECSERFWSGSAQPSGVRQYCNHLLAGVRNNIKAVDRLISKYAENWRLDRMATIDRNVLRIACFELVFSSDIPPKVAINEAIEIAKKYGDKDSGKFINGILDRINREEKVTGGTKEKE